MFTEITLTVRHFLMLVKGFSAELGQIAKHCNMVLIQVYPCPSLRKL